MKYKIETVILAADPLFSKVARLLDHILGRQPTYGDIACYLAYRFTEVCFLPVVSEEHLFAPEVLSLSILDHEIFNAYIFNSYAFNLHGCASPLELIVYDNGLYFIEPGANHVAREIHHTPVPRVRYLNQTVAFNPPRIADSQWSGGTRAVGF
jgi:hypothetical protein